MWNLCTSSKLVSQREKKRNYELHKQKLQEMKPRMKIVAPPQPEFVYSKNKLEMSRRDRQMEIDHQNQILLAKMRKISNEEYTTNKLRPEAQNLKTLNQHIIFNENRRICENLMRVHSYYPTLEILEKTNELEKVMFNISEKPVRSKSAAHLRPQHLTHHTRFHRSQRSGTARSTKETALFPKDPINRVSSQGQYQTQNIPRRQERRPASSENFRRGGLVKEGENAEQNGN